MKLLILVLSYNVAPFSDFMRVAQETWDKEKHPDIDVIYYYGNQNGKGWNFSNDKELLVNCTDDYNMMHWKLKLALDAIDYHKYDLIFRTNSCSYIVKDRILKVAKTLPLTDCYAGWCNGTWISGAGVFFSPDVLDLLRKKFTPTSHGAEDVLIGQILTDRVPMLDHKTRIDADKEGFHSFYGYHFRAKTSNDNNDRYRDVANLIKLHKHFV